MWVTLKMGRLQVFQSPDDARHNNATGDDDGRSAALLDLYVARSKCDTGNTKLPNTGFACERKEQYLEDSASSMPREAGSALSSSPYASQNLSGGEPAYGDLYPIVVFVKGKRHLFYSPVKEERDVWLSTLHYNIHAEAHSLQHFSAMFK